MRASCVGWALVMAACNGRTQSTTAPVVLAAPSAEDGAGAGSASAAPGSETKFVVSEAGELATPPFTFRVVPLAGPGTKGPSVLAPESDPALEHVAAYLRAHAAARVRIEGVVNAYKTSSGPNAGLGAHRANLVARGLVARGVECGRLDAVGVVDQDATGPAERIRVLVATDGGGAGEAKADPCRDP